MAQALRLHHNDNNGNKDSNERREQAEGGLNRCPTLLGVTERVGFVAKTITDAETDALLRKI